MALAHSYALIAKMRARVPLTLIAPFSAYTLFPPRVFSLLSRAILLSSQCCNATRTLVKPPRVYNAVTRARAYVRRRIYLQYAPGEKGWRERLRAACIMFLKKFGPRALRRDETLRTYVPTRMKRLVTVRRQRQHVCSEISQMKNSRRKGVGLCEGISQRARLFSTEEKERETEGTIRIHSPWRIYIYCTIHNRVNRNIEKSRASAKDRIV